MDYQEGGLEEMRRGAGNALAATPLGVRRNSAVFRWPRRWIRIPTITSEARWVWLAVAAFIAMSVWWLAQDSRVPDWDTGSHEGLANILYLQVANGRLTAPFTDFNSYPPLVHLLGAISIFVAGFHPMAIILSSNIVFVPLLAFGCFGVGRIAYGPRAGVLAAVLALGSPMLVSMMHEYELDPAQAAMVAISLWALLASRRFERVGIAAVAGGLVGLAMMTKQTSVVFLAGPVLVVVLRGGWRNPLGLLVFLLALAGVAGPWYAYHLHDLQGFVSSFTAPSTGSVAYSSLA